MKKKDVFANLPKQEKSQGEKINYKSIAILIGVIVTIGVVSFSSVANKKKENNKKDIATANQIQESEVVATTPEEMEKIAKTNPLLEDKKEVSSLREDDRLEELKMQQDYELKKLALQYENERLSRLKSRQLTPLSLIEAKNISEIKDEKKSSNPYEGLVIPPFPEMPKEDPNLQEFKKEFAKNSIVDEFILTKQLQPAISKYEVKAGTIIPLTLETSINSDLPGNITAVVKRDVYDSATGTILLIPGGSKVIGKYSSDVSFGQERVQVVFNRITLPNQKSINIDSMIGVDKMGASGVKDRVNTKIGKVFSSVIMSAILGVGSGSLKNKNDDDWRNNAINEGGSQAINVGNTYSNKLLNVQPSLEIRNGYTVGIFVEKDLILEEYREQY